MEVTHWGGSLAKLLYESGEHIVPYQFARAPGGYSRTNVINTGSLHTQ
jgi:hypothetical protein